MNIKKLNRNAFNEKIIHRYLFERLYFGDKKTIKKLLPEHFHKLKINLITPEESRGDYRADLVVYFQGKNEGIPIEVKWSSKSAIGQNQIDYLIKNEGILISFDDIGKDKYKGIDYRTIDFSDFSEWISKNISKLTRESLLYQANVSKASKGNQFWVVYLRGTAHENWDRMLKNYPEKCFWAYKQNSKALRNIFDIQKGDLCLFIKGYAKEGMGMSRDQKLDFEYSGWYLTKINEPYYMALDEVRGTFFESENPPINERRWPHFMDFELLEKCELKDFGLKRFSYGKRGEFSEAFADSVNNGSGTPAPLRNSQWETLIDTLRYQKEKITHSNNT